MKSYHANIEKLTLDNIYFRKVIHTGEHSQLVLMCLKPGEEIGVEVHHVDQFFRLEQGSAKFIIDKETILANENDCVIVSSGATHNVTNTGNTELKLYTIYSPPNHPEETVHKTKEDAELAEKEHQK